VPLVATMLDVESPVTGAENVAVIGIELILVVDEAVEERTAVGPPAAADAMVTAARIAAAAAPAMNSFDFIRELTSNY